MNYKKISYLFLSTSLVLASILPSVVQANESNQANVSLKQGEFTLKTSETVGFGAHQIENKKKTVTSGFVGDFGVIDARGTQEGYEVTVSASPFTIIEPSTGWVKENPYQLPSGSLSLASLKTISGVNSEHEKFHPSIETVDKAIYLNESIKITSAELGKGMGEYALAYDTDALSLVIDPLTAKIDTVNYPDSVTPYESTLTWNLISGPSNGSDTGTDEGTENGSDIIENENTVEQYYGHLDKDTIADLEVQEAIDFTYIIHDNDTVTITGYTGTKTDIVMPYLIEGKPVVAIGYQAFSKKGITSFVMPNTVTFIDVGAFQLNSLGHVVIPDSVVNIADYAFEYSGLTSVVLPKNLETIGNGTFLLNELTSIDIPASVKTIGNYAFANNKLTSVNIPNNVTSIGQFAFQINQIETLTIPNSVTYIGQAAFNSNKLTTLDIPNSITSLEQYVFNNNKLTSVTIPESVINIGAVALGNNQLTSITIPSSVKTIGDIAFVENPNLKTVVDKSNLITDANKGNYFSSNPTITR